MTFYTFKRNVPYTPHRGVPLGIYKEDLKEISKALQNASTYTQEMT